MSTALPEASELADRVARMGKEPVIDEFALRQIVVNVLEPITIRGLSFGSRASCPRLWVVAKEGLSYHGVTFRLGEAASEPIPQPRIH